MTKFPFSLTIYTAINFVKYLKMGLLFFQNKKKGGICVPLSLLNGNIIIACSPTKKKRKKKKEKESI
jgi:hypothetical protein